MNSIMVFLLFLGYTPFIKDSPLEIYSAILNNDLKFPKNMDKNARGLCKHFI